MGPGQTAGSADACPDSCAFAGRQRHGGARRKTQGSHRHGPPGPSPVTGTGADLDGGPWGAVATWAQGTPYPVPGSWVRSVCQAVGEAAGGMGPVRHSEPGQGPASRGRSV